LSSRPSLIKCTVTVIDDEILLICRTGRAPLPAPQYGFRDQLRRRLDISDLTLPQSDDAPTQLFQFDARLSISCGILFDLLLPEVSVGLGQLRTPTAVAVPETSMNEDGNGVFRKNEIRTTGQVGSM
jgi:hypothetical protein